MREAVLTVSPNKPVPFLRQSSCRMSQVMLPDREW